MKKHKPIRILDQKTIEQGWEFVVALNGLTFNVTLDRDYWQELTNDKINPEKLIELSFEYLLANEPKESILREFNLHQVNTYFPSFETDIKTQLRLTQP